MKARRLAAYVSTVSGAFDWATNNCCHFAAGWVRSEEGRDPMPVEPMTDAKTTHRLIDRHGGLAAFVSSQLGRAPIAPSEAQIGDLVMVPLPDNPARASVGICNGRTTLVMGVDGQALFVPTLQGAHAWRVEST
jgi:hypothetical protein